MEFNHEPNHIFAVDASGSIIAEVNFPNVGDNIVNISHTFVDRSLRGQGVASQLLQEAYKEIKEQNKKAVVTCSYAVKWFEEHAAYGDILIK